MKKTTKRAIIYAVTAVLSVSVIAGGLIFFLNLTPAALGFEDRALFGELSLSDIGLADVKIIDIFQMIWSFRAVDESKIIKNAYSETKEREKAADALEGACFGESGSGFSGKGDYSRIAKETLYYPEAREVCYSDTTIAYILNEALNEETETGASLADAELSARLRDSAFEVKEVSVSEDGSMRMVFSLDTASVLGGEMSGPAASFLPEKMYAVSYLSVSADKNGVFRAVPERLFLNESGDASAAALNSVAEGLFGTMENGQSAAEYLNDLAGTYVTDVINHLGAVGTAKSADGVVIPGSEQYGESGICDGEIRLITHTVR